MEAPDSTFRFSIVYGLIVALIFLTPTLLNLATSQTDEIQIPNAADEEHYLHLPYLTYSLLPSIAIYSEHNKKGSLSQILASYPNAWLDYLAGALATRMNLTPLKFGLVLDLLFVTLSTIVFLALCYELSGSRAISLMTVILMIELPNFGNIAALFPISLQGLSPALLADPIFNTTALFRGVYTQVSYPFYAIALWLTIRACRSKDASNSLWLGTFLSASLIYIYFFSWAAASFFNLAYVVLTILLDRYHRVSVRKVSDVCQQLCLHGLVAATGIYLSFSSHGQHTAIDPLLSEYWHANLTYVLIAIGAIGICLRAQTPINRELGKTIAVAAIGIVATSNIQPVLGRWISSHQITGSYLGPTLTTATILLLFHSLQQMMARSFPHHLPRVISSWSPAVIVSIAFSHQILSFEKNPDYFYAKQYNSRSTDIARINRQLEFSDKSKHYRGISRSELGELVRYITDHSASDTVIASLPTETPFIDVVPAYLPLIPIPNLLAMLTNRPILFQDWFNTQGLLSSEEMLKRESFLGWLYSDRLQLLWPCIDSAADIPGDIYQMPWTQLQILRASECQGYLSMRESFTPCDAINQFSLGYVVHLSNHSLEIPAWYQGILTNVWQSHSGAIVLYQFNKLAAIDRYCPTHDRAR